MITYRNLKPGDRLPTEVELVKEFGVSRSTLREAMKVLRAENVVVIRQGSGTFISSDTGVREDALGLSFVDQKNLLRNLYETRALIEPHIAGLAAQRATSQDVESLEQLVQEMESMDANSSITAEMDVQFHTAVAKCTHNEVLIRVIPIINESIRRCYAETCDNHESFKRAKRSHRTIMNAIAQGDYFSAKFMAERHVWESLEDITESEEALSHRKIGGF
ncbi:MAG: FadR family transcriptional regulator [Lachnospiraceae bacterium]|nr:FadR family transcriptional regulator [Lachnospiraceae bacterium]